MRKGKQETYLNRCDDYSTQKEAFDLLFKYVKISKKMIKFGFHSTTKG